MSHDDRQRRTGNGLIDRLADDESRRLTAHGELIELAQGEILYQYLGPIPHVYFPTSGCCCHIVSLDEGRQIEAATIGKEGMVGVHRALGLEFSPCRVVSVIPGEAIRIPMHCFLDILRAGGMLDALLKKYAAYCLALASQAIACATVHSVAQRVCQRLLMAHDRVGKNEFWLTQDLLGQLLGVRRQSITLVARELQAAELIEYRRGVIKIMNRRGLKTASCECYETAKTLYDSILTK